MISKSELIQIHYELAMSIGTTLDLEIMLKKSLTTFLRKLNCPAGGVHFFVKDHDGIYQIEEILTIPKDTRCIDRYQKALTHISTELSSRQSLASHTASPASHQDAFLSDFKKTLPFEGVTDEGLFNIVELPDLGVIIFINNGELDSLFLKSLGPIFTKLAIACNACLQNELLIDHQNNLQKRITEKTVELVSKNQQLTTEIEHRERYEEALRKSEEKYRELVQNANSIILRWDTQGKITFFNEYAQSFFGFREDEIIGRHVVGTIVPEDESTGRDLATLMGDICRYPQKYEYNVNENMRKDGSKVWIAWTNKVITDERGNIIGALSIGADVTEHRKSEQRFRLAAEAMSDLIYEWDIKENTLRWFGDIDTALGYGQGEFPQTMEAWLDKVHPEDRSRLAGAVAHHQTSINPISYDYKIQRKDGSWVHWSDYGVPLLDSEGKPSQWIGACTDITERKKAEQELIESEERYRALFTNDIDAICIFEIETKKIVDVNDAWLKLYGYRSDEVDSLTIDDLSAELEATHTAVKRSVKAGTVFIPERHHLKKDGSAFVVELSAGPFTWKGQQLMYALVRDITERKLAEQTLQRAKEAAEAANKAKSAFLANMSHELRTPLNAIIGFSELMTRNPSLSREQLKDLGVIVRSGEHLLSLINDVLEFSKIEAGQILLHQENFDLHRFLSGLKEMFHLRVEQKGLYLDFQQEENVPRYIRADQGKLRQILINLLGNAVKFTKTGGITLCVKCRGTRKSEQSNICPLYFEVMDTGLGIAHDEQARVFDSFFQAGHQQLTHQGTGLGLPISQKFVRMMGGNLELKSDIGKGANFSFEIPVEYVSGDDIVLSQQIRKVIGLMPEQPAFRLLVVEDNENNRNLLVRLLRAVGFEVREAVNGKEAIELWKEWHPHLIWMDICMPVMDGYGATRHIKELPGEENTVIIALTASAFEEDRMKIIEHGGNDFVRKPFREAEIFRMLEKHLGVKFIYEDDEKNGEDGRHKPKAGQQNSIADLKSEAAALAIETLARLAESTELSDAAMIDQVIEDIRIENAALADALAIWAENFAYDNILKLIHMAREQQGF